MTSEEMKKAAKQGRWRIWSIWADGLNTWNGVVMMLIGQGGWKLFGAALFAWAVVSHVQRLREDTRIQALIMKSLEKDNGGA